MEKKRKMLKKMRQLLKVKGIIIIILFLGSCQYNKNQERFYIQSRIEICNSTRFSEYEMYCFSNKEYAVREKIYFDSLGKVDSVMISSGICFYRTPKEKQLSFSFSNNEDKYWKYSIKLNTLNHSIIDGMDTIYNFQQKEGKLYYEDKNRGSFYIYEIGFLFGKEI